MLIGEILKKEVIDANANKVGTLTDVDFDLTTGTLNYYVLKEGMFGKEIHFTPDKIDKIGQKVILKISKAEVENPAAAVK